MSAPKGRCLVCSDPLPQQEGPGRPRVVCPGECARQRERERRRARRHRDSDRKPLPYTTNPHRPGVIRHTTHPSPWTVFPNGGFHIE